MQEKTKDELGEQLYKILSGWRYIIILDDMWSIKAWNEIKFFFPENYNRSRIIVTTRISEVANHFGSSEITVDFLDDNKSWNLFCDKAFPQEGCPPELEEIGKKIVKKCKGLPLSIVVIGGLFGKSSRTQEYWENVANDISSILNTTEDNHCFNILLLSYNHLPSCLQPCFLYLGIFPEDYEIRVSRLIKLWVAEGFLRLHRGQSLEEVAEGYIKDLIDRNLLLVRHLGSNGKFKTCYTHDLRRDLCIRVAQKEKFLCVMGALDTPRDVDREHRIVIHGSIANDDYAPRVFHNLKPTSLARSLICKEGVLLSRARLLRVLIEVYGQSQDVTFQQVNLRFLAQEYSVYRDISIYKLPSSISQLWNLQTIINKTSIEVVAPSEIWEMRQLRHLKFVNISLPDPPSSDEQDDFVLQNLQTLKTVLNFKFSEEVFKRIANSRKLRIWYDQHWSESSCCWLNNFGCLSKLELPCYTFQEMPNRSDLLQNLTFPSSLKKLTLQNCGLHWNDLTIIGSLPHLEVLRLFGNSVEGPEWNPSVGEFLCLKFLHICSCRDQINWNADSSHFPVLENLILEHLCRLDEIPSDIGEIPTLKVIHLDSCSISAAISALKILEEQESLGNQGLQVRVLFWHMEELEEFREQVEQEGFTSHNFQLSLF